MPDKTTLEIRLSGEELTLGISTENEDTAPVYHELGTLHLPTDCADEIELVLRDGWDTQVTFN